MTLGKRLFDLAFATVLAIILAPVLLVLVVVVLVTSGRPVFYAAERMRAPTAPSGCGNCARCIPPPATAGFRAATSRTG